ncbi:MAG: flagellar basal body-associated FliL family protein [Acidimicrobiia bacterium]|nr:flagellar basal body-associated FliL family protein [Acidimicrobiia bacterium]
MADEENEEEEAAAAAAKKKKMIIGGVLAAGAVYRFVLSGGEPPPDALAAVDEPVEVAIVEGEIIQIPEMTLNLADKDELHFARIGLAVVLLEGEDVTIATTKMPLVQDVVVDVIGEMTFDELREPGAKDQLREVISEQSREAFNGETVSRILFTSFVMQ